MRAGEFADGEKTLRAKIDMASPNINMRDPILYRVSHMAHHNTGDAWCIYPMYDFAHPIEDAVLCTTGSSVKRNTLIPPDRSNLPRCT